MTISEIDLNYIAKESHIDFLSLKNANVFIAGASGFIGKWLLESFFYANEMYGLNAKVTVLSRDIDFFKISCPMYFENKNFSVISGDIRNFEWPHAEFTHAIHAATDVIATNTPLEIFDVTVLGTKYFLNFCKQAKVHKVLLLSSGAVYGVIPQNIDRVAEDYSGSPSSAKLNSAYGIGKIATEWLGTAYSSTDLMQCKSARIFAQVGPYLALDKQFAAGNFLLNALRGEEFLIKGDGTPRRSYMYAADLIIWLWGILNRGASGQSYNVGSDHGVSILELAKTISMVAKIQEPKIRVIGVANKSGEYERYVPDISKAAKELNLGIKVTLEDALERTLRWYKAAMKGDK